MKINVTFTGIDSSTVLSELPRAHHIEYGVLFSTKRCFDQKEHRYPDPHFLRSILEYLAFHRTALHICGTEARRLLLSKRGRKELSLFTDLVSRIQVNGQVEFNELCMICSHYPDHVIITQYTVANACLVDAQAPENHMVLLDASGGEGKVPVQWIRPPVPDGPVGFAGGLNPTNIEYEGGRILELAQIGDWIDMESGVRRDGDWFDTAKMYDVLSWVEA